MPESINALQESPLNQVAGRRIALVVGVNEAFHSSLPSLKHSVRDAQAMAETLHQHCDFELLEPPLLEGKATSAQLKRAVLNLCRNRKSEDFLLFYFSGHGQPMAISAGLQDVYIVTSDFHPVEVEEDETLHASMRWLREKLYLQTAAGKVLVILDCCFAGDMGKTAPDQYLKELRQRIAYYFEAPGTESGARSGGLRFALTASGHRAKAIEREGHGLMTGLLLPALQGEIEEVLDSEGQISLQLLHRYLERKMKSEQPPGLSGDSAGLSCILADHSNRLELLRQQQHYARRTDLPRSYIPYPRNVLFQPRLGEFEKLESLLDTPSRTRLVGIIGLGGIGKTQLAVELAYRFQKYFPDAIFWMSAGGMSLSKWQQQLADLAIKTDFLPLDDNPSHPENEMRRARYLCYYLSSRTRALLILDNVETPSLITSVLTELAGKELSCTIIYTSRSLIVPPGATIYNVEQLPEESALRLLLETTRPRLLSEVLMDDSNEETRAASFVCQSVSCLPLALMHLRGLLARDQNLQLVRLAEVLRERGILEVASKQYLDAAPLFATFLLSWEKVENPVAQQLFKLAVYFPEAAPIPLWLLGLATGLNEDSDIFEPLGEASMQLRELSLLEELSGEQVRLHPLVREFGQHVVLEDKEKGKLLLEEACGRLIQEFEDLHRLERRARREGYWHLLYQVRAAREYVRLLSTDKVYQLSKVEHWLDRESYLLGTGKLWPDLLPPLFYQQIYNRAIEEGQAFAGKDAPPCWVRQLVRVGMEDQALLRVFAGHSQGVTSIAISPDGTKILTGSDDQTARLWESDSGKLIATFEGHEGPVMSVTFSPDGTKILTGSDDQTARLWETTNGNVLMVYQGHRDWVRSVAFSPDGTQVLTGSDDQTAKLWNTSSGRALMKFERHQDWVRSVAFSPDGTKILTGSTDQTARLWDAASGKVLMTFEGHQGRIQAVAFSHDGKKVLTGSDEQTAQLWDVSSGRALVRFEGHQGQIRSVAFLPDETKILTGSTDQTARLWDAMSGKALVTLKGRRGQVQSVAFSPDGTRILVGSDNQTAQLWETVSRKALVTFSGHRDWVRSVAFSPDGSKVLTGSTDQTARMWDAAGGKVLMTFEGHQGQVRSVAFSPDSTKILTGSDDQTARLWEMTTGEVLTVFKGHQGQVRSVAFSPDGSKVLTGSFDYMAQLWGANSGRVQVTFKGHKGWIRSVAFSPDGTKVLTGSSDKTARLWEAANGKVIAILEGHSGFVSKVSFSTDGHLAITCDIYGQVRFWQVNNSKISRLLGIYTAMYEIGDVLWQSNNQLLLADQGGPRFSPYFYQLKLEGM